MDEMRKVLTQVYRMYTKCNFCGKKVGEVEFILTENSHNICDECVAFSVEIIATERAKKAKQDPAHEK